MCCNDSNLASRVLTLVSSLAMFGLCALDQQPSNSLEKLRLECMDLRSKVNESAAAATETRASSSNNLSEVGSQCDEDDDLTIKTPSDNCLVDLGQRVTSPDSESK